MGKNQKMSVYQEVMRSDFYEMPVVFQQMHGPMQPQLAKGQMEITHGKSILAKICTPFMPIPSVGTYPLELSIDAHRKGERWLRKFPKHQMTSIQYIRKGQFYEQFGWIHFSFVLQWSEATLCFKCLGQYLGVIRLPGFLSVRPDAIAIALDDKSWEMDVRIYLWGILLAQYKGVMQLVED